MTILIVDFAFFLLEHITTACDELTCWLSGLS